MVASKFLGAALRSAADVIDPPEGGVLAVLLVGLGAAALMGAALISGEKADHATAEVRNLKGALAEVKRRMSVARVAAVPPCDEDPRPRVDFSGGGDPDGYCGPATPYVRGVG